ELLVDELLQRREEIGVLPVLDVDPAVLRVVIAVLGGVEVKHLHARVISLTLRAVSGGWGPLRGWHFLRRRPGNGSEGLECRSPRLSRRLTPLGIGSNRQLLSPR